MGARPVTLAATWDWQAVPPARSRAWGGLTTHSANSRRCVVREEVSISYSAKARGVPLKVVEK